MRPTLVILTTLFLVPAFLDGTASFARADDPPLQDERHFELEAQLGSRGALHTRVGFRVDPHAVILLGPTVFYTEQAATGAPANDWTMLALSVPLELKVYFSAPAAGEIAPMLRAGIFLGWDWTTFGDETMGVTRAGASLGGGVAWFANDAVGLEIELGGAASRAVDSESNFAGLGGTFSETSFTFGGRAGVVLLL